MSRSSHRSRNRRQLKTAKRTYQLHSPIRTYYSKVPVELPAKGCSEFKQQFTRSNKQNGLKRSSESPFQAVKESIQQIMNSKRRKLSNQQTTKGSVQPDYPTVHNKCRTKPLAWQERQDSTGIPQRREKPERELAKTTVQTKGTTYSQKQRTTEGIEWKEKATVKERVRKRKAFFARFLLLRKEKLGYSIHEKLSKNSKAQELHRSCNLLFPSEQREEE